MATVDNQISWQSAYWALVAIAPSTISQPCGKFCGLSPRVRTWLRISPIFCVLDCIQIFAELARCIWHNILLLIGIEVLLEIRFANIADKAEGLQALEDLTFVRWLFFVLGSLPQAIKLFSCNGIPWTKAWAVMYLISFTVIEGLVLVSGFDKGRSLSQPPTWIRKEQDKRHREAARALKSPSKWISHIRHVSFLLHYILLWWALSNICKPGNGFNVDTPGHRGWQCVYLITYAASYWVIFVPSLFSLVPGLISDRLEALASAWVHTEYYLQKNSSLEDIWRRCDAVTSKNLGEGYCTSMVTQLAALDVTHRTFKLHKYKNLINGFEQDVDDSFNTPDEFKAWTETITSLNKSLCRRICLRANHVGGHFSAIMSDLSADQRLEAEDLLIKREFGMLKRARLASTKVLVDLCLRNLVLFGFVLQITLPYFEKVDRTYAGIVILMASLYIMPVLALALSKKLSKWKLARTQVFMLDGVDPSLEAGMREEWTALCAVTTFWITVLFGTLWYALRYDAAGTSKPGWTDVLG